MRPMPGVVGFVSSGTKVKSCSQVPEIINFSLSSSFIAINLFPKYLFVQEKQKKVTPTKGTEMKRTRRDRREMEDIIFKLFERQPNWALKQLVQETDQPEVIH